MYRYFETTHALKTCVISDYKTLFASLRSLNQNLLKELPAEISELTCLKQLQVSSNLLKKAPVQISGLKNLEWL